MASSEKLGKISSSLVIFCFIFWICFSVGASTPIAGCSEIPVEEKAELSESSRKSNYTEGDKLEYNCQHGYASQRKIIYTCKDNIWTKMHSAKCSLKRCELPEDIPNGRYIIVSGSNFVFGTTIKYICKDGYQMMNQADSRTCRDGGWDNRLPSCEEISCVPDTIKKTVRVEGLPDYDEIIRYGHRLTFSCFDQALILEGAKEVTCQSEGKWSDQFPTCVEPTCPLNTSVEDSKIKWFPDIDGPVKAGHSITLSCTDPQLKLNGQSTITCQRNGQWTSPFPKCEEAFCVANLSVNMRSDVTENGKPVSEISVKPGRTVTVSCVGSGSKLQGPQKITCMPNGDWNHPFPKCIGGKCQAPSIVKDADTKEMSKKEYNSGEKVEYVCFDKYVLDDRPPYTNHLICQNGEWKGNINCIQPCSVTVDEMDKKGIRLFWKAQAKIFSQHKDYITFACQRGVMMGNARQQCNYGVMTLPECV